MEKCISSQELREEFNSVTPSTLTEIKDSLRDDKSPLRRALAKHFVTYPESLLESFPSEKEYM